MALSSRENKLVVEFRQQKPRRGRTTRLYREATTAAKQLWLVPGGGHTDSYKQQPHAYEQRVLAFFSKYFNA